MDLDLEGIMLSEVKSERERQILYDISDGWNLSTFSNWMTAIRIHVDNESAIPPGSCTEKVTGETTTAVRGPPDLLTLL